MDKFLKKMYDKSLVCFHLGQFFISIQVHHSNKQKTEPTQNQDSRVYCSQIESSSKSVPFLSFFYPPLLLNPALHIPIIQIAFVILKADHFYWL